MGGYCVVAPTVRRRQDGVRVNKTIEVVTCDVKSMSDPSQTPSDTFEFLAICSHTRAYLIVDQPILKTMVCDMTQTGRANHS